MSATRSLDNRYEYRSKDTNSETPDGAGWWEASVRFTAQDVVARVNAEARTLGLTDPDTDFTTATKIGRILTTLRIRAVREAGKKRTREREITRRDADRLLRAYAPAVSEAARDRETRPEPPSQQPSLLSASVLLSDGPDPWDDPSAAEPAARQAPLPSGGAEQADEARGCRHRPGFKSRADPHEAH